MEAIIPAGAIVSDEKYFKAKASIKKNEIWDAVKNLSNDEEDEQELFLKATAGGYECLINVLNNTGSIGEAGGVKLSLEKNFLHDLFPRLYALAISSDTGLIPNEPYTPFAENISLNYLATESIVVTTPQQILDAGEDSLVIQAKEYEINRIKLFHKHPFGQCEEHNYLSLLNESKGITDKLFDGMGLLPPYFYSKGEFFIGLSHLLPLQTVSLLIQVLEGSENPVVDSFSDEEKIEWSILCSNTWKSLENNILSNNTENFLTSGILRFSVPTEATDNNTLLPGGKIWVKASLQKEYNAVCKVIDVHTHAALSTFDNSINETHHLENGLPCRHS